MPTDEMTTQEVAEFLACAPSFVRQLRIDRRLPGKRRVGPTWVFDRAEVTGFKRAWDRRRTGRPPSPPPVIFEPDGPNEEVGRVSVVIPPKNGKVLKMARRGGAGATGTTPAMRRHLG